MQNVKLINLDHRHYEIGCIREVLLNGGVVEFSINYKNRRAFKLQAERIRIVMYKIKTKGIWAIPAHLLMRLIGSFVSVNNDSLKLGFEIYESCFFAIVGIDGRHEGSSMVVTFIGGIKE